MVTRIIHSQLQYIYPASLCHKEKNCLLTDIWLVLTAWKNKNIMSPSGIQGRWKKDYISCHLHKTIQLLPCGVHPLIYLRFFLVVKVGCLRKKNFFSRLADPMWHITQKLSSCNETWVMPKNITYVQYWVDLQIHFYLSFQNKFYKDISDPSLVFWYFLVVQLIDWTW